MTTSGTVGRTVVEVSQIIDEAFRRCGTVASAISGESLTSARLNLYTLTAAWANRGLSLWCVQKYVLGVQTGKTVYDLPAGTVDLLNALYRTSNALAGGALSGAGYSGYVFTTETSPVTVGVAFTVGVTVTLVVESSTDGVTWTQRAAFPPALYVEALTWAYQDIDNTTEAAYWRVRDTSGTLPAVDTLVFSDGTYEVPMSPLNRDDYTSLPNKTFSVSAGSKSLQYWYDKQVVPRMWVWPISDTDEDQIVCWVQRQIQDVGSLTYKMDVPDRWLEGIIMVLASRVALVLPPGQLPEGRLEFLTSQADVYLSAAENGESDGSPIRLVPNIRGYTR